MHYSTVVTPIHVISTHWSANNTYTYKHISIVIFCSGKRQNSNNITLLIPKITMLNECLNVVFLCGWISFSSSGTANISLWLEILDIWQTSHLKDFPLGPHCVSRFEWRWGDTWSSLATIIDVALVMKEFIVPSSFFFSCSQC